MISKVSEERKKEKRDSSRPESVRPMLRSCRSLIIEFINKL